ncbi:MAG: PAS domain-containing protein [Firmicutes bacterium]|nr:PAS domain-containing protein [Bacillota bacterium]
MEQFFKSVLEHDRAAIVLCNTDHTIIYMNPAAIRRYSKRGGDALIGKNLLDCHSEGSREIIQKVVSWFAQSESNNMMFIYNNQSENKDVYMVALRDETGRLIGYYEKHEYRTAETAAPYNFDQSLI